MAQQSSASASCVIELHKYGEIDSSDDDASSRTTACPGSPSGSSGARQTPITSSFVWADEDSDDDLDVTTPVACSADEEKHRFSRGNPNFMPYVMPGCNQAFHLNSISQQWPVVAVGATFVPCAPYPYFAQPVQFVNVRQQPNHADQSSIQTPAGRRQTPANAEADALDAQAEALEKRAQELLEAARLLQARQTAEISKKSGNSPKSKPASEQIAIHHDSRTTLMVKNLPAGCTHEDLCRILDEVGLAGLYNFIYVPFDFKKLVALRYGFVNFERNEDAVKAIAALDGFAGWVVEGEQACEASWSGAQQGLDANIERYRNSPVMHSRVPDEYKPVLLEKGVRIAFPAPTQAVKPPKLRSANKA